MVCSRLRSGTFGVLLARGMWSWTSSSGKKSWCSETLRVSGNSLLMFLILEILDYEKYQHSNYNYKIYEYISILKSIYIITRPYVKIKVTLTFNSMTLRLFPVMRIHKHSRSTLPREKVTNYVPKTLKSDRSVLFCPKFLFILFLSCFKFVVTRAFYTLIEKSFREPFIASFRGVYCCVYSSLLRPEL